MTIFELNLDGLVGPTHHYGGLASGNKASQQHAYQKAHPKEAALQSLHKMQYLHQLGFKQALLPPHERPNLRWLHAMGFQGTPQKMLDKAYKTAPQLLHAAYSQSSMWAANSATVSSEQDTKDRRLHFTPANLVTNLHRAQETSFNALLLKMIFHHPDYFYHHPPLPATYDTRDEGAANYNRLSKSHASPGLSIFIYGKDTALQRKYASRQAKEASKAIARSHGLLEEKTLFVCQNPKAIDAGVFHNDVISLANESVFLLHEEAFVEQKQLKKKLKSLANFKLHWLEIPKKRLSLSEAVKTYFFNSQLLTHPVTQRMHLLLPTECQNKIIAPILQEILDDKNNPIEQASFLSLNQSMQNGGGPACLRLRVPISEKALFEMDSRFLITENLLKKLETWVNTHYRDTLSISALRDVNLMRESLEALDQLTKILGTPALYPFQKD